MVFVRLFPEFFSLRGEGGCGAGVFQFFLLDPRFLPPLGLLLTLAIRLQCISLWAFFLFAYSFFCRGLLSSRALRFYSPEVGAGRISRCGTPSLVVCEGRMQLSLPLPLDSPLEGTLDGLTSPLLLSRDLRNLYIVVCAPLEGLRL